MRAFDRDLIRGGHYGQRSYDRTQRPNTWPHRPTARVKILLANSEPPTHGPFRPRLLLSNLELITLETLSARIRPEDLDPLKGRFSGHPQHTGQPETDFRILDDGKIRRTWSGTRATTGIAQKVSDSMMRF